MIRILHAADLHLDSPFQALGSRKAALRRAEQRGLLEKIVGLAREKEADILLLAGDLFDSDASFTETGRMLERVFAGVDIPVFGLVKDEHHKTRTVVGEEEEIGIARDTLVFPFLYKLQEEVHRFTVSGMSSAKRKTLRTSSLEKVKGIGPAKAKALLAHFGTLANMRLASVSQIEEVRGVSRSEAENVYEFLHKTTKES